MDADSAARAAAEVLAAGGLGVLGALARRAVEVDDKPMLRPAMLVRVMGDASIGIGCWLILSAAGYEGVWSLAAAWIAGALGFAALHDVLLRILNRRLDRGP